MKFKEDPIDTFDLIYNDRFLYNKIIELENNIIKLKKYEKRKFNEIYGRTAKKQKDYIPITRLDLMTKELKEKGINSIDIGEKVKIQYAINILYQLRFKLKGE